MPLISKMDVRRCLDFCVLYCSIAHSCMYLPHSHSQEAPQMRNLECGGLRVSDHLWTEGGSHVIPSVPTA